MTLVFWQTDAKEPWMSSTYAQRSGRASDHTSCDQVHYVPQSVRRVNGMMPHGIENFYTKYMEAYGIPVIGVCTQAGVTLRRCHKARGRWGVDDGGAWMMVGVDDGGAWMMVGRVYGGA